VFSYGAYYLNTVKSCLQTSSTEDGCITFTSKNITLGNLLFYTVRLAALYSGGKDSTFSIFKAKQMGHEIACLVSMYPSADESLLFHYPNIWLTDLLAKAMRIPLASFNVDKTSKEAEIEALEQAITAAKSKFEIDGIVHGAISSNFQNQLFKRICESNSLTMVTPLWNIPLSIYLDQLLAEKFRFILVSVSAMGLQRCWLGKIFDRASLDTLISLSKKFGFNLAFEGGEAETLVLDCPLFVKERINIDKAQVHWDGQRGIFEILEASLVSKK
jgi:ABC transporter with metal-binding/Fe-S-binding domain ATP-binding protein